MLEVAATPYSFEFVPAHTALVIIDMQRDFLEPGGFGAALGNDVSRLASLVETDPTIVNGGAAGASHDRAYAGGS